MIWLVFEIHRDVHNLSCSAPLFTSLGGCHALHEFYQYYLVLPHRETRSSTRIHRAGPERPDPGNIKNEAVFK